MTEGRFVPFVPSEGIRGWAKKRGARWITQQCAGALTVGLLAVAAAATSDLAFKILVSCAYATMIIDSLCLYEPGHGRTQAQRARERMEADGGWSEWMIAFWSDMHCSIKSNQANFVLWLTIQTILFLPLALMPQVSTPIFFVAIIIRELLARMGPFTAVTAEYREFQERGYAS